MEAMTPIESIAADLHRVFGDRLRSLLTFGVTVHPGAAGVGARREGDLLHTLAIVASLSAADLTSCATLSSAWIGRGLATPLILREEELVRSLDAFPLELTEIMGTRRLVAGTDPFLSLSMRTEDVRRACEAQARSYLLHLREAYIEAAGQTTEIARVVRASAAPMRALVVSLARLESADHASGAALGAYARHLGLPAAIAAEMERPAETSVGRANAARTFGDYLEAAERIVEYVDRLVRP
jgi:hypothetical protein